MQKRFNTEILDSFLNNRECLQAFLDSTGVESLKDLVAYDAYLFESDEIANRSQTNRNEYVNGFVISAQNKKIYIISPSNDTYGSGAGEIFSHGDLQRTIKTRTMVLNAM